MRPVSLVSPKSLFLNVLPDVHGQGSDCISRQNHKCPRHKIRRRTTFCHKPPAWPTHQNVSLFHFLHNGLHGSQMDSSSTPDTEILLVLLQWTAQYLVISPKHASLSSQLALRPLNPLTQLGARYVSNTCGRRNKVPLSTIVHTLSRQCSKLEHIKAVKANQHIQLHSVQFVLC